MPVCSKTGRFAGGICGAVLALVVVMPGCSRSYYRTEADMEAYELVAEKSEDPRWGKPDFSIEMDPRSRFYDPYDPDCPPMPPDDPASHEFMHCVYNMDGYKHWHDSGDLTELESPYWRQYVDEYAPLNERGEIVLNVENAVRLARMHLPSYQQQLETLYLSALDVSTERFRFDVQFFGGNDTTFTHLGDERGPFGDTNTLSTVNNLRVQRRFATAGQLIVNFANSFVWQFSGPDESSAFSIIDFTLVQPLLRAGGRAVALEQLTIAERALLANLRAFERYRHGFYTNIAVGDSGVQGPQRRGGFFGGTGLTGFTGQGTGGFGGVGQATGFGQGGFGGGGGTGDTGAGTAGFVGGGAGTVGGFLGLLQQLQQIRNTEVSLSSQLRTLALLEANLNAGLIDIAQVDQFRQNIESERANLLQARNALTNAQENFKIQNLGLPPDIPVALDDSMIVPFQLIDPHFRTVERAIDDFVDAFGELPLEPELESLRTALATLTELHAAVAGSFDVVERDLAAVQAAVPLRSDDMTPVEQRLLNTDLLRLRQATDDLRIRLARAAEMLAELKHDLNETNRRQIADQIIALTVALGNITGELTLVEARSRLETVTMETIELTPEAALGIARANRLDWMNNRAALVDTWRLIEFNANALQSGLDIVFSGDISTIRENAFEFRGPTGSLRAGLQFDAPLTRLIERNNFRQQLISYQQDRRRLIQFEDGVKRELTQLLRQLEQLKVNLEIQRRAVAIAIRRVDQTREVLNRPTPPVVPGAAPQQFGPTSALNLLTALSDLRSSQNNFMSVWLNYYGARMTLMRQLGIMQLDDEGLWIDEPIDEAYFTFSPEEELPPSVPGEWFSDEFGAVSPSGPSAGSPPAGQPPSLPPAPPAAPAEPVRVMDRLRGYFERL